MLDFFRNHQRLMMALLLLIVLPGLGFVGIQGFRGFFDDSANVAAINGHKITRVEFDGAFRQQIDQARQALGGQFDIKAFDTPEHRKQVLDGLIQQRVLADETQRLHLTASDNAVRDALMSDPMIASLKKPDGSIDVERYAQLLSFQGMTPEQYQERVRYSLALQQIPASIVASAFTPKGPAQRLSELAAQQREVQALVQKTSDYAAKVQPTDAQLTAYYDAHKQSFATPETATIQYLVYSPAAAAASAQPNDADIKKFYDDNPTHFRSEAQVRVSHIFIAAASDASAADKAAAKAKAEQLLADVKAHPDQFAQIAQKNSQDAPSAAKGGDLGFITRGSTAGGKAFDDAAFALKQGDVSGVVQSDLGFHILKATEVKPSVVKPFADVKDQIAVQLKQQYAAKAFTDNAEGFTSTVYEKAKTLQPAADKYKLTIQTATVMPTPNPQLPPTSPLNNPKFLAAVFASDSVKSQNNTQAIDVGNNTLISARVTDYKPAAVPALDTIKDAVRQKVVAEQATELAKKDGAAKLAELQKSKSADGFTPVQKVSRMQSQGLTPAALSAVYKVDAKTLPAYVGVDLGADGYAIYRVNAVIPGTAVDPQQLAAAQQQMAQVEAQSEGEAYLAALRDRSKVKLYGTTPSQSQDSGN
ncbi:PPIC-type PPIASE domain protein [Burkholderia ambifaria AMMD]|uniref:Periplasmic chaperone PpiD n=1 Tax=Burkholderia ambifaria (strain ATCC BAA-244 / DSM 16087 / CCUG 44356 / LMG 19182 / AMMD) TaxID=339670 RepID=Q0BEF9_BURCM|nr:SurA N-terminal domain-containing protein [Burkholderia ambifaria]ABI87464.1 PpiC-type peptidyl-prolyl cis-trans isomerase [Burkholderia ambifaria AMMD]AJY22170.1 PPIC-type PPIASE domain protein [Burkholderia ambifaria AMMD]MBR7928955.1 SurA N-terminal domain-containing protein [Burkholderia ambifaria]PEH65332.1 peptidylprolyl isomerase [Burkholderia ambifaria]QQC05325.1 SurA N-terminal domain-containing protein [Burkholderia ambifaria]